jgi:2-amino-4-hydroxy-6-hydroxymethyldihydropteridine diphosphokinase
MVALETSLTPRELLDGLQAIEEREGRTRHRRWDSRTLDLDIVCFDAQTASDPDLEIPHPGLANRAFWQRELAELREKR